MFCSFIQSFSVLDIQVCANSVICSLYTITGTNWAYEIISMLLHGKAEIEPMMKMGLMVEVKSETELDQKPSPRVLNTHLPLSMLPRQMKEKKTKVVWVARNPKDAVVSFYYHITGLKKFDYSGKFGDFLKLFFEDKCKYVMEKIDIIHSNTVQDFPIYIFIHTKKAASVI